MTEIATVSKSSVVSTFKNETFEDKARIFDAVTNAEPFVDHIGEVVNMVGFTIQDVTINDTSEEPLEGEGIGTVDAKRVTIVGADGKAYAAISVGVINALRTLVTIMGMPETWPEEYQTNGLPVKFVQISRGKNRVFTLSPAI